MVTSKKPFIKLLLFWAIILLFIKNILNTSYAIDFKVHPAVTKKNPFNFLNVINTETSSTMKNAFIKVINLSFLVKIRLSMKRNILDISYAIDLKVDLLETTTK